MKTIETGGITYVEPVPGGTDEWYYGISYEHGDLYEAEELFRMGREIEGRKLCLVRYPDGAVFWPAPKTAGSYSERPVYLDGAVYVLNVVFPWNMVQILRFDCESCETEVYVELPLDSIADCYNLGLNTAPLTLRRQGQEDVFEIYWPERVSFPMGEHESFFLRDGDRLFFNKWHEEGEGEDYCYWEETVVRDLSGKILEVLPGDVLVMPNGEKWHLK
jgi:hypothetical protein